MPKFDDGYDDPKSNGRQRQKATANRHAADDDDNDIKLNRERIWPKTKNYRKQHRPDATDKEKLAVQPKNLIALASFPGSGNTWLRYLLQQATGKCMPYRSASVFIRFLCAQVF